ncbi:ArnT family glycosyltransferase [Nicoliella lavandulae]|uniref:Glycosyltransferase RgtA/B/C/D-like domain-containing protein n=1 Tax=Nicoliella lavandulae TaxID=3082954 RepID=A0ABU8SIZ3_9LACO
MKLKQLNMNWFSLLFLLIASFIIMTFLSTSSPLYLVNPSPDANIMMTVGKGFWHGLMPYHDLFDNRGPLIYLFYSLVALVNYHSFTLVFILEALWLFIDLILGFKILRHFMRSTIAYPLTFFIVPLMFNEFFFQHGDTPESMVIPFLLAMIYQLIKHPDFHFSRLAIFSQGLFVGIAFWIKYTFLIPWFGIGLVIALTYLFKKQFQSLFRLLGWGGLGYAIVTVPILVLYNVHHILFEMLDVYFMFNLKYYNRSNFDLMQLIQLPQVDPVARWVEIMVLITIIMIAIIPKLNWRTKAALEIGLILETISIITVKVTATYYYTLMAVFSIFILVGIGILFQKILPNMVIENPFLPCLLIVLSACATLLMNQNYRYSRLFPHNPLYSLDHRATEPYQMRFAKVIDRSKDRSLLVYKNIDVSLYTKLGTLPNNKYFVKNNLNYQPMIKSQAKQLKSLKNNFVLTIQPTKPQTPATRRLVRDLANNKTLRTHYHLVDTTKALKFTSATNLYDVQYDLYQRNQ